MAPWDPSYPSQPSLLDLVRANAWAPPNLPLFRPSPSQFAAGAQGQPQPNPLADGSNVQSAELPAWPFRQASTNAMSPPRVLSVSDQAPARPWWVRPPGPPIFDEWEKLNDKGNAGLYNFLRSFGGARSSAGGGDDDYCYDRWDKEVARCEQFRPFGFRYYKACTDRARDRHNLCIRNGGRPDPNEPDQYTWNDLPRDDPDR